MFSAHRSIRPLAVGLLATAAIAVAAAAPAAAADPQVRRAQATEQYLQSFGAPATPEQQQAQRARATEQYLQSYGASEPIVPSGSTSETPWLPIALAGAFVLAGLGAVQIRRVRRRTGMRLAT
jgi:hypothetical protein